MVKEGLVASLVLFKEFECVLMILFWSILGRSHYTHSELCRPGCSRQFGCGCFPGTLASPPSHVETGRWVKFHNFNLN